MLSDAVTVKVFNDYGFPCKGLFANRDVPKGTVVWWWEKASEPLEIYTRTQIEQHPLKEKLITYSYMVGNDQYCSITDAEKDTSFYINHSCDPTTWYDTDNRVVTLRDVKQGEQFTCDYALTESESSMHYGMRCRCGSAICRGVLTFTEWRSRAFIKKNYGHLTDFIFRKHCENSWYDSRVELRHKEDGMLGMFCRTTPGNEIRAGDKILVFSGKIVSRNEILEKGALSSRDWEMSLQIQKDLWQIPAWKESGDKCETTDYVNHSCDPTCGMLDSVTVVAIRDLQLGEEITIDYAMVNDGLIKEPSDNFECTCKSRLCRGKITSNDWSLPELQERYKQYFSPFMQQLIKESKRNVKTAGEPTEAARGESVATA